MLNLTVAVPVPLVLFICVLALATIGYVRTKETTTRMVWVAIGYCEVMLALVCFVGIDALFHQDLTIVWFVVPITFSFISLLALLGSSLLMVKGKL